MPIPLLAALLAGALAVPTGAAAQNAESEADRRVQDAISRQETQAGVHQRCPASRNPSEAIVVCGTRDPDANRLPLRDELDSARSTNDGLPRAPDLFPHRQGMVVATGCFFPPCPKKPVYYFDLAAIPETPPGSEAERVGKGEIARP